MIDLKEVERVVRIGIVSFVTDDRYEDAVQEALIRAWKDIEAGETENFWLVANRAKIWARSFLGKPHARPTGAPKMSRDGKTTAHATLMVEKVKAFTYEFNKLHGRGPSGTELASGLGMNPHTATMYQRKIREGRIDHAMYDESEGPGHRRAAASYFKPTHITDDSINQETFSLEGFEDTLIAEMDFFRLVEKIPAPYNTVLYLRFALGYTTKEIAEHMEPGVKYASVTGQRRLKKALEMAKEALYGKDVTDTCRNGHLRTEDNTRWSADNSRRYCVTCEKAQQDKHSEKNAAKKRAARAAAKRASS